MRAQVRFAVLHQTAADAGADSDVKECAEIFSCAEQAFRQSRRADVRFENSRGDGVQFGRDGFVEPLDAIGAGQTAVAIDQFADSQAEAWHGQSASGYFVAKSPRKVENRVEDGASASLWFRWDGAPCYNPAVGEVNSACGDFRASDINAEDERGLRRFVHERGRTVVLDPSHRLFPQSPGPDLSPLSRQNPKSEIRNPK